MRIQTTDGYVFEGADAKEIVRKMRDTQWGAPVLKREYMEEVKDRLNVGIIHDKGADAFLTSLSDAGLIRFVPENEIITDDTSFNPVMNDSDNEPAFADDADVDKEHSYDADVDDDEPAYTPDPRD